MSLKQRVRNHKSFFQRHPTESSLFKHVSQQLNEHCIDFENPRVLDHTKKSSELYIREAWEINNSNNLMNDILEISTLPGPFRGLRNSIPISSIQDIFSTNLNANINNQNDIENNHQDITTPIVTGRYFLRSRKVT